MRILFICDRLSTRGGADWHLHGILDHLAREHQLLLLVGRREGDAEAPCEVATVPGLAASGAKTVAGALDGVLAGFAAERIHAQNVVNPLALAWLAEHGALLTVQDHRVFCPGRGKLTHDGAVCTQPMSSSVCAPCFDDADYHKHIYKLTRQRADAVRAMAAVTVLSPYMRDALVQVGVQPSRVAVIPPFVHALDRSAQPDGPPCVLFAGRLSIHKGVDHAIAAWRRSGTQLPLVFAGTGPLRASVADRGFETLGWLNRKKLACAYARAAALLLPSMWQEPFGIVGLEALHMGVPVVAYDSGGVAQWHRGDGLVAHGDERRLAEALQRILAAPKPPPTVDSRFARQPLMDKLLRVYAALGDGQPVAGA